MSKNEEDEAIALRLEIRQWLDEHWDPELALSVWRERLVDSGWGCPTWPREWYGRSLSTELGKVVTEELSRVGAVGPPTVGVGMLLAAPALFEYGSQDLKSRLLRSIVTSENRWCELFSEPGCGSDLAGLTTRAERDGDEWVINGQKVWTTGALQADYAILLARTDWDVPKHKGITAFALPMRPPGVEVRALRQMNNHASFNEVFLTDARVSHADVIGEVNGGWAVALTTLANERALGAALTFEQPATPATGRISVEAAAEATEFLDTYKWYPQRAGRSDLVVSQAQATGTNTDLIVRQRVAEVVALEKISRWNRERGQVNVARGRPPGSEASLAKLCGSEIARVAASLHAQMEGAYALLTGQDSPLEGIVAEVITSVPASSIAGGTDEIQRNIIGERVLGLPREPAMDVGVPFREVRTNDHRP